MCPVGPSIDRLRGHSYKIITSGTVRGAYYFALLFAACVAPAQAAEYTRDQAPAPESVEELDGPIVLGFPEEEPPSTALLGSLKDYLKIAPPFLSDLTLDVNFRTYDFYGANGDKVPSAIEKNEAWAGGGSINLESGLLWDAISVGGEYFASLPISAPDSRPGTGLLKPIQNSIFVLGQAYVRATLGEQVITLGQQRYDLPYLNGNDSRMIPNTFEGYSIDGRWSHGRFVIGYVDEIKPRASDDFIPMSRALGVTDADKGLVMAGVRYDWENNFVGAIASVVPDVLSTVYSELDTRWSYGDLGFRLGMQFTDQRSIGDDLLTSESFDTQSFGARFAVSLNSAILTTAFTYNSDGARIRTPFGGDPSFSSLMLSNFNLANQKTFRVGLSYNGNRIGFPWLSGFLNYARGVDSEIAGAGISLPDDEEIDLTIDFRGSSSPGQNIWLRVRGAVLNPGEDRRIYNVRVIFNWAIPVL